MAKFKVVSVGDGYCVVRLGDDGLYTVVEVTYSSSWHGAEEHMRGLQTAERPADWYAAATNVVTVATLACIALFLFL